MANPDHPLYKYIKVDEEEAERMLRRYREMFPDRFKPNVSKDDGSIDKLRRALERRSC